MFTIILLKAFFSLLCSFSCSTFLGLCIDELTELGYWSFGFVSSYKMMDSLPRHSTWSGAALFKIN